MGSYATVLFILGLTDRLADLADSAHDRLGLALEAERLPKRVRTKRSPPSARPLGAKEVADG